jgi:preprotein translocase subunit SecA
MKQFKLKDLIPPQFYPEKSSSPVENRIIRREIARAQKIIEDQNFKIRRTLEKYNVLVERQRQMIFRWRYEVLFGKLPGIFMKRLPEKYAKLLPVLGPNALLKAEQQVLLHFIISCWTDYLDFISYTKESIHLVSVGGKVPIDEFNKIAIESFGKLYENIEAEAVSVLSKAEITQEGIDLEKEGLRAPSSTWTYLVDDSPEQLGIIPMNMAFNPVGVLLILLNMSVSGLKVRWKNKRKKSG